MLNLGLPAGVDPAFLRMGIPTMLGDYEAFEKYDYFEFGTTKVNCPLTAFLGSADSSVSKNEMLPWKDHTTGRFDFIEFGGGAHHYLNEVNFRDAVILELEDILMQV